MKPRIHTQENAKNTQKSTHVPYRHLFWIFFVGSVVGFLLEGLWSILRLGMWENHSATVIGPFCIVYGIGAVVIYALSARVCEKKRVRQFIIFGAAGAAVEFFASLLQEAVFGSVSWDYTDHFLNLGGRVSLQMTLIWGALGLTFSLLVYPRLASLLQKTDGTRGRVVCIALTAFMVGNLLLTAAAILRWRERADALPASNEVEAFLDQTYGDATMRQIFSNMTFTD